MDDFKLLIGGRLVAGESTMNVVNPATEELLAEAPHASRRQVEEAIEAAHAAFPAWAARPLADRRAMLVKLADAINQHAEEFARLLVQEQGKPLAEAVAEIAYTEYWIRHLSGYDLPTTLVEEGSGRRVELHRVPLGVVSMLIPWNFPILIVAFKLPCALLAGNTIVIKPAPTTPLTTLRLGELCNDIFPAGVVNVVTDQNEHGPLLSTHPLVAKITLTGSTETGRKVMASAAATIKRITLELGGNDAAVVLADADPKAIAKPIIGSAFMNCGQLCIAIKRLYVHESIYDAVCDELASVAEGFVVDDGLKQGTTLGPLQNRTQYEKVKAYLEDARTNGRIIAGGQIPDRPGFFVNPTIVRDISDGTRLVDEEQFGPILPVIKYSSPDDAIKSANGLSFGLGASIWSADVEQAYALGLRMDAGTVWINKHSDFGPNIPFAGAKQSGLGVEFGNEGLSEFTQVKVMNVAL